MLLLLIMLALRVFTALALRLRDRKVPDRALGFDMKEVVVVVQVAGASKIELEQTLHTLFRLAYTKLTHIVVLHELCDAISTHQRDATSRDIQLTARPGAAPNWREPLPVDGDRQRHTVWVRAGVALPASSSPPFGRTAVRLQTR